MSDQDNSLFWHVWWDYDLHRMLLDLLPISSVTKGRAEYIFLTLQYIVLYSRIVHFLKLLPPIKKG